jgi:biopolymer transport protein TolR
MDSRQSALMAYRAGVRANGARAAALEAGLKPHKKKRRHRHHHAEPAAAAGVKSDINVTPLVDVCLVLLIIFMVVTPMLHRGPEVQLPQTKNHTNHQDTGEQIVVSVRSDGTYVEADKVGLDDLGVRLEKELKTPRPVNVRADYTLKFGEVRKVLEKVHASGAPVVNMETKENKE